MLISLAILLIIISTPVESMKLNDGHIHYNQDIWDRLKPEEALRLLNENNLQQAIVSSTPTLGTEKLFKIAPEKIIPFLRPYRNPRDRYTWHSDPSIIDYVKGQLDKGFYKGFGEFHLFKEHKNTAVVNRLMQLIAQHQLVISAHSDAETIETLLNMQSEVTVIWAHCGMDHPVDDIKRLLEQYSKLFCELSFREGITDNSDILTPEWKELLQSHSERFITGSDTYIDRRWAALSEITDTTRNWLKQLPANTRDLIAYKNLLNLFE